MIYERYVEMMREENCLDFASMMSLAVDLLDRDEGLRARYARRYRHILVDEVNVDICAH